jgi:hypothetical protein
MADGQFRKGYRVISDKTGTDAAHRPDALKRRKS